MPRNIIAAIALTTVVACFAVVTFAGAGTGSSSGTSTGAAEAPAGYVSQAELDAALGALALTRDRLELTRDRLARKRARLADVRADKWKMNRLRKKWKRRASRMHRLLYPYSSSWRAAALCVHSREGSWTDPNAPYYGGMQMDLGFQRAYGGRWLAALGTADRWHPDVQLLVAYRGYVARGGWNPWPNTARACGLPLFVS